MIASILTAAAAVANLTICADRPSKANGVCTVPALHWQIEVSGVDWVRNSDNGAHSQITSVGSTFAKLGLSNASDVEVGFTPYLHAENPGFAASGLGDTIVRYKQRLTAPEAPVQAAVIPFVKIPTATHSLGNGKLEGGVAVPVSASVAKNLSVTIGPEVDALADDDRHGRHVAIINLVNLSIAAAPRLSLTAELWNSNNLDPDATHHLWSADAAAAYLVSNRVQIDVGGNFGLTRATPDVEFYGGVSILF